MVGNKSWHHQFKHSAYIYVGGLHPGFTEGDVVIVFSQFGEIVDCNLIRDAQTGKPKGFAYICYEDQRSTVLAVDNMNGAQILKRTLRVDHVDKYKAPKEFDENDLDAEGDPKLLEYNATGAEGKGHAVYNVVSGQKKIDEIHRGKKGVAAPSKPEDEDEKWAKLFEAGLKDEEKSGTKSGKEKKSKKSEKKDLKEMLKEAKRLKKEAKKVKKDSKGKDKGKKKKAKSESSSSSKSSCSSI